MEYVLTVDAPLVMANVYVVANILPLNVKLVEHHHVTVHVKKETKSLLDSFGFIVQQTG